MSESSSLLERIDRLIESDKLKLPVFNPEVVRLRKIVSEDDCDIAEVERLILGDQALAAEVLRAANSPFYGGLSTIRTIRSAIVRLGVRQVTHLVCLASEHAKYTARDERLVIMLKELWRHSSSTAMTAEWLARRFHSDSLEEECFLGGLLHDVGELLILRAIDELKESDGLNVAISLPLILEVLDAAHTRLGRKLLQRWNIPEVYCRIAGNHHEREFDITDQALVMVRLANEASKKLGAGLHPDPSIVLSATPEANILKASEVLLAELEIMLEDHFSQAA